ncbi:hypothetical protein [Kluyvera sp. CHPC 1.2972]|uniref:hypothetical protein n=1 Tax=Kluyvera sp. CHPC 1.2972 TaxID=2995176 RepID=UPI002FD7AB7A
MQVQTYKTLPKGMQSFSSYSDIPIGSNTFNKNDITKSVLIKSSTASAALQLMDLGKQAHGTTLSFSVDVRCASLTVGSASIEMDSRSGNGISAGRKIVGVATTSSLEWVTLRIDWIVADGGNWISLAYGASTTSQGTFEFRNPRLAISGERRNKAIAFNLLRSGGVWTIDAANFFTGGAFLISASGDQIAVGWPGVDESLAPAVSITIDTGFSLASAGFVSAGPNTVTNTGCNIKLIQSDGAFKSDVLAGGTARLHVVVTC